LSQWTCSYICMYKSVGQNSVMLYLQHDFYKIVLKTQHKLYNYSFRFSSPPSPKKKEKPACALAHIYTFIFQAFPNQTLQAFLFFSTRAAWPAHLILPDLIIRTAYKCSLQIIALLAMEFAPASRCHFSDPNVLLSIQVSNTAQFSIFTMFRIFLLRLLSFKRKTTRGWQELLSTDNYWHTEHAVSNSTMYLLSNIL
jgi:hypothetical protein